MINNLAYRMSIIKPGTEPITLLAKQPDGVSTISYSIVRATRKYLTKDEYVMSGDLIADRWLIWEFWSALLADESIPDPKVSDSIVDSQNNYYAIRAPVSYKLNRQIFICTCQLYTP